MKVVELDNFNKVIKKKLKEKLGLKSIMEVPFLQKIIVNSGLGEAKNNKNLIGDGIKALEKIVGQKTIATLAKKSVAGFKLREEMPIGAKVTIRGKKMYDLLARINHVYIPRVRDFRGVSNKSFDGRGNYTLGFNDMRVFPEVPGNLADNVSGLSITFVTSANDDGKAKELLTELGLPFAK